VILVGDESTESRPGRFTLVHIAEARWAPESFKTTATNENSLTYWDSNSDPPVPIPTALEWLLNDKGFEYISYIPDN
jgi:hypothetical protein